VLGAPDADQGHLGRAPGGAEPVEAGRDQPGHVRPVAVVVDVLGVDAGGDLAGPVDQRDVGGEVAAQPAVEVGPQVGGVAVDAGGDDADQDPAAPLVDPVRATRGGVDHPHVPLPVGQRLLVGHSPGRLCAGAGGGPPRGGRALDVVLGGAAAARDLADGPVAG